MADPVVRTGHGRPLTVVVSGDVTMDWNLAREPLAAVDEGALTARASWQRGGAALLSDLVESICSTLPAGAGSVRMEPVEAPHDPIPPGDDALNHSYALWTRFPRAVGEKGGSGPWRGQSFLGVDRARTDETVQREWDRLSRVVPEADVVVLDDAALGFRDRSDPTLWRRAGSGRRPWVVLKQACPTAEGQLWEHLLATARDRLVVVLTIDDLRGREIQVSRELSWERTAQDLLWELVHKPKVNALSHVAHTVVSFGPAGAVLVSAPGVGSAVPRCTLFYDPDLVEGTWSTLHPGDVMGVTGTLTAALVREILLDPRSPRIDHGIQAGVAAARRLHLDGYEQRGVGRMQLGFPVSLVVEEMQSGREPLQRTDVSDPSTSARYWTILEQRCTGDLAAEAAEIVLHGPEQALTGVPLGRFGKLVTADRSEIEAFRSIGGLIGEYVGTPQAKPLSIGVFGPPGAGKSFGVKEVARAVGQGQVDDPLEFNLAQLTGPEDLADAFHLVRDRSLAGKIPLVFWDEFDTTLDGQRLGWLRYFLAPMQDGEFRQGQLTHPIGRSIFVFAGGTCARVEDFSELVHDDTGRMAKGPDFVSRLKGFVNILGPNPHGETDPYHVIRRAILLRSILQRNAKALLAGRTLRIDPGVLRAFLETKEYRHGARSMEAIIAMSRLAGKSTYERSSLPAEPQLDLHVDAEDFLALVQRPDLTGDLLERLARAAHDVYCEGVEERREPEVDSTRRANPNSGLVPFDDLVEVKKEQNRRTVRDIPAKLMRIGCVMVPGRADLPAAELSADEVETLARYEHDQWMHTLGPGWRWGETTDVAHKIHCDYRAWEQLPASEKDKDRDLVRQIPAILGRAGYTVVRTRAPAPAPGSTTTSSVSSLG